MGNERLVELFGVCTQPGTPTGLFGLTIAVAPVAPQRGKVVTMTALIPLALSTADAPSPPRVVFDLTLVPWWPYVLVLLAWFIIQAFRGRAVTYWRVVWTMVGLAALWTVVLGYLIPAIRKS